MYTRIPLLKFFVLIGYMFCGLRFKFVLLDSAICLKPFGAPFCIILEAFGVHWASLEGSLEEGWFLIDFWRPKWSQSGALEASKIY